LDRLSRQRPRVVSTLLGRLLDDYGLEVHLTGIKKVLLPESQSAAEEGMDLLYVTMLAIRASEEQETKAGRLSDAFGRKRLRVEKGEALLENAVSSSLLRTFHAAATVPLLVPVILPTPALDAPWVIPSRTSSKSPLLRRISS
jgi:hypothetical protein